MTLTRTPGRVQLPTDVAEQVRQQLARVQDEWASQPLGLGAIAARLQLLPLYLDWNGFAGLDAEGRLFWVDWDEPHDVDPVLLLHDQDVALSVGSKIYPFLAGLLPQRPHGAKDCSHCGGSGVVLLDGVEDPAFVCFCGGLGWIPPDWGPP